MTTVTFRVEGSRLAGLEVRGHSGYAPVGEDIVCAAVTSALRLAECTLNDVMGLGVPVKVREREASVALRLPAGLPPAEEGAAQALLAGLMVHLTALRDEYPAHIEVLEAEQPLHLRERKAD